MYTYYNNNNNAEKENEKRETKTFINGEISTVNVIKLSIQCIRNAIEDLYKSKKRN